MLTAPHRIAPRWSDDLGEDFDRCPDDRKDAVRVVLAAVTPGRAGDRFRRAVANAVVCYCRGGDRDRGFVLANTGEPIFYRPRAADEQPYWLAAWDRLAAAFPR